jgi:hypothetical protein
MRVKTDENVQVQTRTGIIGKTFGGGTAMTKENNNTKNVATRPMGGKVISGLKGGARRPALGDISNAGPTKVQSF